MEFFVLYLFVSVEKIAAFLSLGGGVFFWSLIALLMTYFVAALNSNDREDFDTQVKGMKKYRRTFTAFAIAGALMFSISELMPNKKELAVIIGGGVTYNILTSDSAKEIGGKAVELLKKEIDNALKDDVIDKTLPKIKEKAVDEAKAAAKEVLNV